MLKAITRKATAVDEKIKQLPGGPVSTAYFFDHLATPDDVSVLVTEEDFDAAQGELVPSVRYVFNPVQKSVLTPRSAKELEHFERIRQMFESTDKQKQEQAASPQTIGDAIEALKLGNGTDEIIGGPVTNGDQPLPSDTKGKGKEGASIRSASGQSVNSKGKGKGAANPSGKWKGRSVSVANGDSDSSVDGPVEGSDGVGDDDYVIRTDHLVQEGSG
jgi:peroxin-6